MPTPPFPRARPCRARAPRRAHKAPLAPAPSPSRPFPRPRPSPPVAPRAPKRAPFLAHRPVRAAAARRVPPPALQRARRFAPASASPARPSPALRVPASPVPARFAPRGALRPPRQSRLFYSAFALCRAEVCLGRGDQIPASPTEATAAQPCEKIRQMAGPGVQPKTSLLRKGELLLLRSVEIGERFGHISVLGEEPRGKHGQRRYRCLCDCGNVIVVDKGNLFANPNRRCRECVPHSGGKKRLDLIGKEVNGWFVICVERHECGKYWYECRCLRCGALAVRTTGQILRRRSERCSNCPPVFFFEIKGDVATGTLPDGTRFTVDTDMVPLVNQRYWRLGKEGYIVSGEKQGDVIQLHRFVLGISDSRMFVDHINRNPKDCRRSNLRVANPTQNSCNHKLFITNKSGYSGVYYSAYGHRYDVKIGYHGKRILLGSSKSDPVMLAQMYNIAAAYLYGEFAGELNSVPLPSQQLIDKVIAKCKKYKEAPAKTDASFHWRGEYGNHNEPAADSR